MTVISTYSLSNSASDTPKFPPNAILITGNDTDVFGSPVQLECWTAGVLKYHPFGRDTKATEITLTISAAMVANGPYIVKASVSRVKTGTTTTVWGYF